MALMLAEDIFQTFQPHGVTPTLDALLAQRRRSLPSFMAWYMEPKGAAMGTRPPSGFKMKFETIRNIFTSRAKGFV